MSDPTASTTPPVRDVEAARLCIRAFCDEGWVAFTGVPCSFLKGFFEVVERFARSGHGPWYVPAAREDSAAALAAGFYLGGHLPVILMQNSGLGAALGVVATLHQIYDLPVSIVMSLRGATHDAVEHEMIGRTTESILGAAQIGYRHLNLGSIRQSVHEVTSAAMETSGPAVLLVGQPL
jgi:sulfopyruvate decarboxylase subunit alpha